jgi:hypothetical protein
MPTKKRLFAHAAEIYCFHLNGSDDLSVLSPVCRGVACVWVAIDAREVVSKVLE